LNQKEQNRLRVLNEVNRGTISIMQASMVMKLSLRQTKRLLAGYRARGVVALAHGNRGCQPHNKIDSCIREQVTDLAKGKYKGFNQQHFSEKLQEQEGIPISRSTVRRVLLEQAIASPRRRRAPRHRSRRERFPQSGMMLQTDGSPHDWLEGRGPKFCLIGAIDDATSEVPYAYFQPQEDTAGYIRMLRSITRTHGIPLALYHDQHSIFEVNRDEQPTLEEQLAGKKPQTQLGRMLDELDINSISANSPQAKGRVERLWNTFQDRLVSELRFSKASSIQEANQVLRQFLADYNRRFMVQAKEPGSAYRQPGSDFKEEEVFCYQYDRTVGSDNVVRFGKIRLQILPTALRLSYARCKVKVHLRLDNSLAVYYQKQLLPTRSAPQEAAMLRKQIRLPEPASSHIKEPKPTTVHPWRQRVYRK
jgi:transposase